MREFIDIIREHAEQLDELKLINPYPDDKVNPLGQFFKTNDNESVVGKIDDVDVVRTWSDKTNSSEYRLMRGDDFLGGLQMQGGTVYWSGLKPSERGKGLGVRLYEIVINLDGSLTSDKVQTTKSKAVWDRLFDLGYRITAQTYRHDDVPVTKENGVLLAAGDPIYSDDHNNVKSITAYKK